MLSSRIRYAAAVSLMTPERAPMEASAPYSGRPAARPSTSGSVSATAARATAGRLTGACCGWRFRTSQSGGARPMGNVRDMHPLWLGCFRTYGEFW